MIDRYDLNEAASLGTMHVYEVTFASEDCRAVYEVEVGGNVTGLDLFETAIDRIYDALPDRDDCRHPALALVNAKGETVIHEEGYSGERDTEGIGFLTQIVVGVTLKEVRRKIPGTYPAEMPDPAPPKRLDRPEPQSEETSP